MGVNSGRNETKTVSENGSSVNMPSVVPYRKPKGQVSGDSEQDTTDWA